VTNSTLICGIFRGARHHETFASIRRTNQILSAVIHGEADYLLTGIERHFEHLYGKRIKGVLVLGPVQYFERRWRA